ncbi:DUF3164 family protein [Roseospira marina]|uniref:DUF3164 family protein n=1 Tax=Roseospira marina TaxID=140057 RepID=A0A5M6I6F2_9PROT|nr:DUF3164 family protein [Roseospira marina]KAA5603752.1 DUF3164 family protein [Roseospira marina]MBB4316058.1 hypothetical protein [Roseospira marina]MBB5089224.1 hypothetical protein [Roseospira marina]
MTADIPQITLPTPAVTPPDGFIMDGKGRLVPTGQIKPHQDLEDQMVRKVLGYAVDLANQIKRFKGHVFDDANTFMSLAAEEYGVTKRGAVGKGNVTFMSFDGLMKFQIAVADRLAFGPELQIARGQFESCIVDWADGVRAELRALVDSAFQTDKEGQVSRDAIFRLLRLDFDDERWKSGQNAIRDSIRVIGSKAYTRFYIRPDPQAAWQAVPIDLAAA